MGRDSLEAKRDYSSHAKKYDRLRFFGQEKEYLEKVRWDTILSMMPKNKSTKILDIGCGTGRGTLRLGKLGYNVIGLDYTQEMLEIAEDKKKISNLNTIKFIQGDANKLPFPDKHFDCVVSFNFIHMFGLIPQKRLINEMLRVMKPNGSLIVEFDSYYKAFMIGAIVQKAKSRTHFNKPSDLKYLIDIKKAKISKVRGAVIPFIWRFFKYAPEFFKYVERISWIYPIKFLAERFYIKVIKN